MRHRQITFRTLLHTQKHSARRPHNECTRVWRKEGPGPRSLCSDWRCDPHRVSWEQWAMVDHLHKDAAYRPDVDGGGVRLSTQKNLWRAVPQCDHLSKRMRVCIHVYACMCVCIHVFACVG